MQKTSELEELAAASQALLQMTVGGWVAQAIHVAAKLGIADLLVDGPLECRRLAEATRAHERSLYRLLRVLASVGVFSEVELGTFALSPLAKPLLTRGPGSVRAWAVMMGEAWHRGTWSDLHQTVQSGTPGFDRVHGMRPFEFFARNPGAESVFADAIASFSTAETFAVLDAYDFSKVASVVDVGGGSGLLLSALLRAHPSMTGLLLELPLSADAARRTVCQAGVEARCEVVAGDFFQEVPAGFELYLLKHVIHDWNDDAALQILRVCRRALSPRGKLLVIEAVLPAGNEPSLGKLLDLEMMLIGGAERSEAEYRSLMSEADLRTTDVVRTRGPVTLIEAVPV